MSALIFHIPHSATAVPAGVRKELRLDSVALERELLRMTDHFTEQFFDVPEISAARVVFPVSRLVVDPERFLDDDREPMAARGMGAVYEKTADLRPLRARPTTEQRQRLTRAVDRALACFGRCLIVDGHSFPSAPLPYEDDQDPDRPDICIGTDGFHTPDDLATEAAAIFDDAGFRIAVNRPFAGTIVPMKHYRREPAVASIMIEINRGLYIDEKTGSRSSGFDDFHCRLMGCLVKLATAFTPSRRTL